LTLQIEPIKLAAMSRIRVLPDQIANQIAAGEVVERPVAVIKELVENSLDAGARNIVVQFRQGGKALMVVEDDGHGMDAEDALLCLERHATSKIQSIHDLQKILSFGFRGEALPSIASVSRFTLRTRTQDALQGTEVIVDGGQLKDRREIGMPVGTVIEVAQLFHTVPVRRKFLKADKTESAHIVQVMRWFALAHPEVGFTVIEDGRTVLRTPSCPGLGERILELNGKSSLDELLFVNDSESTYRISGYVSKIGVSRAGRQDISVFVNHRPIDSRTLSYAILDAYQGYLVKGRYPVATLFLECDPAHVDVNVHPSKREVRFRDDATVRNFVIRTLSRALKVSVAPVEEIPHPLPLILEEPRFSRLRVEEPAQKKAVQMLEARAVVPSPIIAQPVKSIVAPVPPKPVSARRVDWRFIGAFQGSYAVMESVAGGLVLVNVRYARFRILFDAYLKSIEGKTVPVQSLLFPMDWELDPISDAFVSAQRVHLNRFGFGVEPFGRRAYRIIQVPAWLEPEAGLPLLEEMVAQWRDRDLDTARNRDDFTAGFAQSTVRKSIMTGVLEISAEGMNRCIRDLFQCENPLTDPSGRPIFIEMSSNELDRKFHA
jgi:DNA mismatch repair protein MutL